MVEYVTQIESGIMINVTVNAKIKKNITHVKKIMFGTLLHVLLKMVYI